MEWLNKIIVYYKYLIILLEITCTHFLSNGSHIFAHKLNGGYYDYDTEHFNSDG